MNHIAVMERPIATAVQPNTVQPNLESIQLIVGKNSNLESRRKHKESEDTYIKLKTSHSLTDIICM